MNTDFKISRNFITKLPKPHGNCLQDTSSDSEFNSSDFDYIVRTRNLDYNQEYCYSLCVQRKTIDYLDCANAFIPGLLNITEYCSPSPNNSKFIMMWSIISDHVNIINECRTSCPYECISNEYTAVMSMSTFQNNSINGSQSILQIQVYYQNMEYTNIEQISLLSVEDLMSNFGGTLGLFLGNL